MQNCVENCLSFSTQPLYQPKSTGLTGTIQAFNRRKNQASPVTNSIDVASLCAIGAIDEKIFVNRPSSIANSAIANTSAMLIPSSTAKASYPVFVRYSA